MLARRVPTGRPARDAASCASSIASTYARAALAAASASPPPSGAAAPSCTYSLVPHCTPAPGRLHSVTLAGSQESAATLAAAWGQCRGGASCDTRLCSVDQWLPTFGGAARERPRGNAYCPRVTGRRALAARWVPSKESEAQRGRQPAEPQVLQSARTACPGSSMAMLRTRPACSHAAGGQGAHSRAPARCRP